MKIYVLIAMAGLVAAQPNHEKITKEVRHELVMLPNYGVFDDLSYRVDGAKVTLFGQVTQPVLKSMAENVIKKIEGVERVENQIEVLPTSPMDDQIRRAAYRQIYSKPSLERYQMGVLAPIHIIVKNGNLTLTGVVDNASDKNLAGVAANGISGVFSVTNNLTVGK